MSIGWWVFFVGGLIVLAVLFALCLPGMNEERKGK